MVNKGKSIDLLLIVSVLVLMGHACVTATPMGTAFTYQGRFNASGNPANGAYDFEFKLFDAVTAGNQVGSTVTKGDLSVSDGYFTTTLDFGANPFGGDARWLQIAVRPGAETGAYTTLTPRHELTPTPYALYSDNLGAANYIPKLTGTGMVNSVMYESSSNVGVGTSTPGVKLDVAGDARLRGDSAKLNFYRTTGARDIAYVQYQQSNSSLDIAADNKNIRFFSGLNYTESMRITAAGNIGIGTAAPTEKLDVSGNVRCVAVVETSDERLKTDIQPLSGVLDRLSGVRAVSFLWNEKAQSLGATTGTRQIGILAQELEQAFPELVSTPKPITLDELLSDYSQEARTPEILQRLQQDAERTQYKAVNYSQLTVVLLEAVKELQAQNEALERRIQAIETKAQ